MPSAQKLDTHHKALTLNLDPSTFVWTTRVVPLPFCTVPFVMRECDTEGPATEPLVILL